MDDPLEPSGGGGGANPVRSRALGALLDLELDALAAGEAVEVEGRVEAVAVEEVLLRTIVSDEAESAVCDDALDGTGGHDDLPIFSNWLAGARSVREEATTRSFATRGGERLRYHASPQERRKGPSAS
jgi:hypothetical protein